MAKVQEIGPYSAYAIAVKYGYKGTEEEWVQEQEANRKAAEAAAAAAAQSAKDAAASASGAAQSGQQAVQGIKDAQTAAEQAIDTAKQQAVQAAQAEAEKAAASAGQAASSAAEAAQSATNAAAEVGKVQNAVTTAVQAVQAAQDTATGAVADAQQTATQAVSEAQATAVSAVQEAGTTQTSAVESAGTAAVSAVSNAKTEALTQISTAGTAQVSAVGTTGADAVEDVNNAKTAALEAIDAANAALPSPTQSDAGKVPTVKADGSAYELAGPYAPISAAIRPTASGNPVSITDSVEWPLQGMKVYGKSTQLTTTGAQLFDISKATPSWDSYGLHVTFEDDYIRVAGTATNIPSDGNISFSLLNIPSTFPTGSAAKVFDLTGISPNSVSVLLPPSEEDPYIAIAFSSSEGAKINFKFRLMVSLKTPTQWEPYTGGQASPSPNYPQKIVSAGDGGSIDLTLCGANLLPSQDILDYYVTTNGWLAGKKSGNYSKVFQPDDGQTYYIRRQQAGTRFRAGCVNELPNAKSGTVATITYAVNDTAQEISLTANAKYMIINLEDETAFDELMVSFEPNAQYEPYKSQSLTISTPNGLPGIPVESGGNYTDASGQQSACDVKDYGTGKYTQMVGHIESYNGENITTPYMSTTGQLSTGAEVYYVLDEPVVTDISTEELAAYRTLHTYDGTTVVSTAEDVAGIEVRYLADGEKYIDRKISEAIASAAATQLASYDALSDAIHEGVNEA